MDGDVPLVLAARIDRLLSSPRQLSPMLVAATPSLPMSTMRCDYCGQDGSVHYRIRTAVSATWRFACPECWKVQSQQPQYQYGGTRKANRRQR
ncbi:MAG TPA: hypothetical protein DGR08_08730 [Synechococcales bacterium UBA12195]|nr:MAG: hypothetical protein DBW81_08000 [Synechococcus sp. MED-G67]HCV57657.1 hypothetical protein [Synechococcales bacterium UBA12195]